MPVAAKDFFRGAALSLVLGHPACNQLAPLDPAQGRYLVNGALRLWVRHSKDKSPWHFTLSPEETAALRADLENGGQAFLCLTCGRDAVIALGPAELDQVVDWQAGGEQTLTVTRVPGRQAWVSGPGGELPDTIAGKAFPNAIFR